MTNDYAALREDIKALYPDEQFTDAELNEMADRLIQFFAIGVKAIQEAKNSQKSENNRLQTQTTTT
ncbi:hypothetical protein FACS1894186_5390 [Alphaproteobacteria bacterium]|nr:hypothetical protein FACS1894186_5390 [Alphaproteobacteria bacterium]